MTVPTAPGHPAHEGGSGWDPAASGHPGPSPTQQPYGYQYQPLGSYPGQPPSPQQQVPAYGTPPMAYPAPASGPYGAGPAAYVQGHPHSAYPYDRVYGPAGELVSTKSRTVASLLSFFLGALGVDRFYLGNIGMGVAKLLLGWATFGIWPLIDFIVIVAGSAHDGQGARVSRWE